MLLEYTTLTPLGLPRSVSRSRTEATARISKKSTAMLSLSSATSRVREAATLSSRAQLEG